MCHRFYNKKNLSVSQDKLFGRRFDSAQVHKIDSQHTIFLRLRCPQYASILATVGPVWFRRQWKVRQSQDKRFDINLTGNNNIADYTGLKQAA